MSESITHNRKGFTLIELLLVLAIIGIISGIAIPSFIGQRKRARVIGDAISNAKALAMSLESRKSETGLYASSATYTWTAAGIVPAASSNPAPAFTPKGNSQMDYVLVVANTGMSYTLTVNEAGGATKYYETDQTGAVLFRLN